MKVFVVMSNDFPKAVFTTPTLAGEYVAEQQARTRTMDQPIYWKIYPFDLDKEMVT